MSIAHDHVHVTDPPMLAAALSYAAMGWEVFPAPPGEKKSYKSAAKTSNGQNWGKTTDPAEIRRDFKRWSDANIGIPTGPVSGFFVVETDTLKGHKIDGIASLRELEAKHGPLPATRIAVSPSGSTHYYFKYPSGQKISNSTSKIAPGVDVRGDGGMVIAPPSIKIGVGVYEWSNDNPIADAPEWLLAAASEDREAEGQLTLPTDDPMRRVIDWEADARPAPRGVDLEADPALIAAALAVIPNETLGWEEWNRIAMAVFRATNGTSFAAFDQWSQKYGGYNARHTTDRWHAISRSPPDRIGAGTIFALADEASPGWRTDYEIEHGSTATLVEQYREQHAANPVQRVTGPSPTNAIPLSFYNDTGTAIAKRWILKGIIARGETSSWIAPPGKGKSALLTDIAIHSASGSDWRGHRSKERCGVVYFALERGELVMRRLAAHAKLRGEVDLPIAVAARVIDLMSPNCVAIIIETMRSAEKHFGCSVGLAIIDTFAKGIAIGGGDEDKAKDQNRVLANLRRVQEAVNVHIAIVGHTGKDEGKGARGSNAHAGDVDVMVQIKGDIIRTAEIIKANDLPEGVLTRFKLEVAKLGIDEDGDDITVSVLADDVAAVEPDDKEHAMLTKAQSRAMELLIRCVNDAGQQGPISSEYPRKIKVVPMSTWHEYCERGGLSSAAERKDRDRVFRRAKDDLQTSHRIGFLDGLVWIAYHD